MTAEGFRKLALELPACSESLHHNHPDFRVGKRVFATLGYPDSTWGMVKLTPVQQAQFVASDPGVFLPVKGGWGLRGSTNIKLRSAPPKAVQEALAAAWRNTAPATLVKQHPEIG